MEVQRPIVAQRYEFPIQMSGISQLHSFCFQPNGIVEARKCTGMDSVIIHYPLNLVETIDDQLSTTDMNPQYNVNEWVAVLFDDVWYPGCIEVVHGTKLHIK